MPWLSNFQFILKPLAPSLKVLGLWDKRGGWQDSVAIVELCMSLLCPHDPTLHYPSQWPCNKAPVHQTLTTATVYIILLPLFHSWGDRAKFSCYTTPFSLLLRAAAKQGHHMQHSGNRGCGKSTCLGVRSATHWQCDLRLLFSPFWALPSELLTLIFLNLVF